MLKPVIKVATSHQTRRLLLTGEPVTIGRDSANSLAYRDKRLSRFHCVIERTDGGFRVRDLGSRTGTVVNGRRITEAVLKVDDIIVVGPVEIEFQMLTVKQRAAGGGAKSSVMPGPLTTPSQDSVELPAPPGLITHALDGEGSSMDRSSTDRSSMAQPAVEQPPAGAECESSAGTPADNSDSTPVIEVERRPMHDNGPMRRAPQLSPPSGDTPRPSIESPLLEAVDGDDTQQVIAAAVEHDRMPDKVIAALPSPSLEASDLGLYNARGKVVHAPAAEDVIAAMRVGRDGVLFLRTLLLFCLSIRATDLHLEPKDAAFPVRVRVDGMMVHVLDMHPVIASRLMRLVKILCDMDIARSSTVQDGHFSVQAPGRKIDYRVSFTPAMYGQKLVIRVLDQANAPTHLKDLGLQPWMAREVAQVIRQDQGMVLMCGPPGSGKTTTLYALIRDIDVNLRNVITIEDPVEYQVDGVTQMPTNDATGNTFSTLLRSVLRQDPDVILVGEVRDTETAVIAMQAAITGHLVFSTVHAQDAIGTVYRLLNLGIEPYLVASGLHLVLAQRLVRQLCQYCKRSTRLSPGQMMRMGRFGLDNVTNVYEPIGCSRCLKTGYVGRRAIFELLTANDELRDAILSGQKIHEMRKAIRTNLFASLRESGYRLVGEGVTNTEEIDRVVGSE